eukprot:TRINITY_DN66287_c0_g1_i1.p1 TRINITY_DN66287_c0_g1~~TRINITY_DN66287_c0_g1_i1.p1  ORF type:complete len:191 (-),score=30.20 TRINITY_DN66287_c0_g1_i1:38-610(-)
MGTSKRIAKDLEVLRSKSLAVEGLKLDSTKAIPDSFVVLMAGPKDSAYSKGVFRLEVKPGKYPMFPPGMRFLTPVFHPNISESGDICLDTLADQWSPVLSLEKALMSVRSLLTDPNPDHGLNDRALQLFRSNRSAFESTVRQHVSHHAEALPGESEDSEAGPGKQHSDDDASDSDDNGPMCGLFGLCSKD